MEIPVAIVGAGRRGREWMRAVEAHPELRLAAVVDVDAEAVGALDVSTPGVRVHRTLADAVSAAKIEAAIVATPADSHVECCAAALERRLAVLVEKPFAMTLDDARGLVRRAEAAGIPLLVAQNYRYMRAFRTARRIVAEGTLGEIRFVSANYYRIPHDMAASLARLPDTVLWGMAVHHLDALRTVLGRDAVRVVAESYSATADGSAQGGSLRAMLTFDGDLRVNYSATYESSGHEYFEGGQEFYCRIAGSDATLHILHRWLVLCRRGRLPHVIRRGARHESEEATLLGQLARAVRRGEKSEVSGSDNLKTMAIVDACRRSSREGRWVGVQELM